MRIKNQSSEGGASSSFQSTSEESKHEEADENVLNKNSFCIINGSYLKRHANSPKNMNIHEYKYLLQSYKTMFHILANETPKAVDELRLAGDYKERFLQDPVKFKPLINSHALG